MKKLILFLNLSFFLFQLTAQETIDTNLLQKYEFSQVIYRKLNTGKFNLRRAAEHFSFIGEYQKSKMFNWEQKANWGFDKINKSDSTYFAQFHPVNAIEAITKIAQKERVIILNEAHQMPQHRAFAIRILQTLYDQGYRFLGMESITHCKCLPPEICDDQLNERGYPLNAVVSGNAYVREPQYANLIREAIRIGFEIFPYEKCISKLREEQQAEHITTKIKENPEAKFLIYCGRYHLAETPIRGKSWMGKLLKEQSGIDPFTIDQLVLTEGASNLESPFYQMMDYAEEKLFVDSLGQYYNGKPDFELFDALIYHPRPKYAYYNRPDWLLKIKGNQLYEVASSDLSHPILIKAYAENESIYAVPIDVIEKDHREEDTALVLPKGKYRLEIINPSGEREVRKIEIK